jgi:SOS regulatory protein LexA
VVPEAGSAEGFSWAASQASLDQARAALQGENPDAASELRRAFDDASQMAKHCIDMLVDMEPTEKLPKATFKDWRYFLSNFSKDARHLYRDYSLLKPDESSPPKNLHLTFEAIYDAAKDALWKLSDLQAKFDRQARQGVMPSQREPVVESLHSLVTELEQALRELEPEPNGGEVHQVDKVHKADEIRRTEEFVDDDQLDDSIETSTDILQAEAVPVPLLGRIAAGSPTLAEESDEEIFLLPRQLMPEGKLFLLKVAGDSMIGAAIADGDWVVVRQQPEVENGEIAAAIIGDEATVKVFKQFDEHNWLMPVPQNSANTSILADEATILGKVVAVLRRI